MTESTQSSKKSSDSPKMSGAQAISEAEQKRLQKCFIAGEQKISGNVDYAIQMFAQCVLGDPSNAIYLQSFLAALKKKFGKKKAGGFSALFSAGARGGLKKLAANKQWLQLISKGVEILKTSPLNEGTLLAIANACEELGFHETHPVYLRAALDVAPSDPEVNLACAEYAEVRGEFDQAIACWRRISNIKSMAEEAERMITKLQVDKTVAKGRGLDGRQPPSQATVKQSEKEDGASVSESESAVSQQSQLESLRKQLKENPANINVAIELSSLLEKQESLEAAEAVLQQTLSASGNDLKIREHLEDRQIRWGRQKVLIAEKLLKADDTPKHRKTLETVREAQLRQETEVFRARSDRYPENLTWRFELAKRLKDAGNYDAAIKEFQVALKDERREGSVRRELGECFQKTRQYQLAFQSYQQAVDTLTDRQSDLQKRALYRAGVLAMGLKDTDSAQKYLSSLAAIDFSYRDVADRLDKLKSIGDNIIGEND
ncbi:MAG: tetratricopeptide repeat protein [Pirellulales bacterium]